MTELTDQEFLGLKTLRYRLKIVFNHWNVPGEFDDFFQYFHERYLLGYGRNQKLSYFAIDYIRKRFGKEGQRLRFENAVEFREEVLSSKEQVSEVDMLCVLEEVGRLKGKGRAAIGLILIHGLTSREVAFLLDVTESRISQIIRDYTKKIPTETKFQEEDHAYKRLNKVEKASAILGVRTLWLREQLEKYPE